jgi:osmotically-inducible protein OsmY
MSLLNRWFGTKYNDDRLVTQAESAVAEDPLVNGSSAVRIHSENGVITLTGRVQRATDRDRVEGAIRSALRATGSKFERIVNDLNVD